MEYSLERIRNYKDEKNKDYIFGQCSPRTYDDPIEGTIEIRAPRKYKGKKKLERRLETAVKEFYSKQGFNLTKNRETGRARELYFERKINSLEEYLVSIERQGVFFYIHVSRK